MTKTSRTPQEIKSPASKFGQMIGDAFAGAVDAIIREHIENVHPEYELLKAEGGKALVRLEKASGSNSEGQCILIPQRK